MRSTAFGLLLLSLAGCAHNEAASLRTGAPGIEVARAAIRGGSPQIALQVATNILAQNPNDDSARIIQGESLTALGRLDEASVAFETVLQHDPASVAAHIGLGRLRLATDPATAEALFLEALQRQPSNAVALNNLGIARDLQRRHREAQAAYSQATAADPSMTAAQVNMALSLAMDGRGSDAIRLIRPLASDPNASPQMRHDMAAVLTMGGNRAEAEHILSKDLSPSDVRLALDAYAGGTTGAVTSNLSPAPPPDKPIRDAPVPAQPPVVGSVNSQPGSPQVQLAAATSEDAAQTEWKRLQNHIPDAMSGRQASIIRVERDGQVFWRLRTGGFADASEATAFCDRLHAAGAPCVIMR